jgi:ribosomal protein S18 acetylase RimI-like enzyme
VTQIRTMAEVDLDAVAAVYAAHLGEPAPADWRAAVRALLARSSPTWAALVATDERDAIIGYVIGEVRAWEFGSAPAGWITGLSVAPAAQGRGTARALVRAVVTALRQGGARSVRTMVEREDVPVLRLFRSAGFTAGPYTELELALGEGAST